MSRRYDLRSLDLPAPRLTLQGATALALTGTIIWCLCVAIARIVLILM